MPITLTLSDDQALDIVSQVSKALSNKAKLNLQASNNVVATLASKNKRDYEGVPKVTQKIKAMPPKHIFRNIELQLELGVNTSAVSRALTTLFDQGIVKKVKRGTWQLAAPAVKTGYKKRRKPYGKIWYPGYKRVRNGIVQKVAGSWRVPTKK